ncbi:MAG: ABC transporter substrate-binding protein [Candidatus Binatia bacterium]
MSKKIHLTLATGDYESVRALKEGTVKPDGIELTVLTDMTSDVRHGRMIRNREFDIAELSMSNYLVAKDVGLAFTAIPVFLHRRFRHGFIFLNAGKGIRKPANLIGKRVGLCNFHATANLWIRGILEHEHKVPHQQISWFKEDDEKLAWTPPAGLNIQKIPAGKHIVDMLVDGELDAVIDPELIQPILDKDRRVTRLFANYRELEMDYFKRTGIFPIMHTTVIKQEIVDKYPWVPINLMQAFEQSKKAAYKRMENPRIVPLAWFRHFLEEQEEILGSDPWVYGLGEGNRNNIETLMQYAQEQGLISRKMALEELFINTAAHS